MEGLLGLIATEYGLLVAGVAGFLVISAALLLRNPQWFQRPEPDSGTGSFASVHSRLGKVEQRVAQIEEEISHLPTVEDIHDIEKQLIRLDGKVHLIDATTTQTRHGVAQIQDYLLSLSKGAK